MHAIADLLYPIGAGNRLPRVPPARLGIPRLWGDDPERLWPGLRWFVPLGVHALAPSRAYGVERVPVEGGAVVLANHLSALDPPLVGSMCPRAIWWMTKAELLEVPVAGEMLRWAGAFPIRRGTADREALRRGRELAAGGRFVGVFVEGTRQRLGYPGLVQVGGVAIALQEGVPMVPCGVYSFGWSLRRRQPCAVVWGDPLDLSGLPRSGRGYREAAEVAGAELLRLWRLAAEAVAAGFPAQLSDGSRRRWAVGPRGHVKT